MATKTVAGLSAAEREAVEDEVRRAPLPRGWVYDGMMFLGPGGAVAEEHPMLAEALEAHVRAYNARAADRNAYASLCCLGVYSGGNGGGGVEGGGKVDGSWLACAAPLGAIVSC